MAKKLVSALALAALPSALAFRNTSPLFLFSTADLKLDNTGASIAESSPITVDILKALQGCPTREYFIVTQEGVSSTDYLDGRSAPRLSQYMSGKHDSVKTTFALPDVVGQVDAAKISEFLKSKCGAGSVPERKTMMAPTADKAQRMQALQINDRGLDHIITTNAKSDDYTVIYITTPLDESVAKAMLQDEHPPYEMDNQLGEYEQLELKRDLSSHIKRAKNEGGLFERYQYFTPGLFMAFAAIIPLFLILLVGIRALVGMEVSYFAFSKEMGPNSQKKQ